MTINSTSTTPHISSNVTLRPDILNVDLYKRIFRLVEEKNPSNLIAVRSVCKEWQSSCRDLMQTLKPSRLDERIPNIFPNICVLHLDFTTGIQISVAAEAIFRALKQLRAIVIESVRNEQLHDIISQIHSIDLDQVSISYPSPQRQIDLNPQVDPIEINLRREWCKILVRLSSITELKLPAQIPDRDLTMLSAMTRLQSLVVEPMAESGGGFLESMQTPNLKRLSLWINRFDGDNFQKLSTFTTLKTLHLKLRSQESLGSLSSLKDLRELKIKCAYRDRFILNAYNLFQWRNLKDLSSLSLKCVAFDLDSQGKEITLLKNIQNLSIKNCYTVGATLATQLTALAKLQALTWSFSTNANFIPSSWQSLQYLTQLKLRHTTDELSPDDLNNLARCTKLRSLELRRCETAAKALVPLMELRDLRELIIYSMDKILNADVQKWETLTRLTKLNFSFCRCAIPRFFDTLQKLTALRSLDYRNNCQIVNDDTYHSLAKFSNLESIALSVSKKHVKDLTTFKVKDKLRDIHLILNSDIKPFDVQSISKFIGSLFNLTNLTIFFKSLKSDESVRDITKNLSNLKNLKELSYSGTFFFDKITADAILALSNLTVLTLNRLHSHGTEHHIDQKSRIISKDDQSKTYLLSKINT